MYDGLQSPGRNDECWCGSGKKYKKCHLDFDERLEELAETGEEVPPRDLLKTPAEIEGIKRSTSSGEGMPWQTTSLTEVHTDFGKPS